MMHTETDPIKGILLCLFSYFFFSLIGIFEKSISSSLPISMIIFFQNLVCLGFTTLNLCHRNNISLKPQQPLAYVIRIASGAFCYIALFYLIRFIPVSEAVLYQYSASLWIPIIMSLWLRVRMPNNLWLGILVGFIGLLFILKPNHPMPSHIFLIGVLCGILQGISVVAIRKLSTEPLLRVLFYNFLIITLGSSMFAVKHWVPLSSHDLWLLFGVGLVTYLGQTIFSYASRFAHPTTLAPTCYTSILYSGIIGWIFWHEIPDNKTQLGMLLVILGCLFTIIMNKKYPAVNIARES